MMNYQSTRFVTNYVIITIIMMNFSNTTLDHHDNNDADDDFN